MTIRLAERLRFDDLEKVLDRAGTKTCPPLTRRFEPLASYPWHHAALKAEASAALHQAEAALAAGNRHQAVQAWTRVQTCAKADQTAFARYIARRESVPLHPLGSGPLLERPVVYNEIRNSWRVYPLDARHGIGVPQKARDIHETWDGVGSPFALYYLADEVPQERNILKRMATHKVGTATTQLAVTGARAARNLGVALLAPVAAVVSSLALLDPILIGVISTDGLTGDWFALERWNH